jgi:hypothetical protein
LLPWAPSYDDVLHQLYTSGVTESLLASPRLQSVLLGSGVFSNQRLRARGWMARGASGLN